jgi:hypothetical protein
MRPGLDATRRLVAITTTLLAAGCSLQTEQLETTSIECTTDEDGTTTCSENEDQPDGDEGTPDDGDLSCSGTGCVATCEYGEDSFRCSITCENGLTCQSTCSGGSCEISCDCPDGGGGGGCEGSPDDECCAERPDDPACNPPCPDGSENCDPCPDGSDECDYCRTHPEDPQCNPPCPEGEDCDYCQTHPDDPECRPTCEDGSTDEECHCQENPDSPECT